MMSIDSVKRKLIIKLIIDEVKKHGFTMHHLV